MEASKLVSWLNLSILCNLTLFCRLLSIEIKETRIKCLFKNFLLIWYASIPRHRPKTSGRNIWPVASNLTSRIHCAVVFHLIVLEFGCWTVETEKQTHTIWKQIYMSASNINMIISGTTAIVRVQVVDPWTTNNTSHWLNWTPLVNWYALKIRPQNLEIAQQFSSNVSWIDVLCPWLIFWLIVAYREHLNGVRRTANISIFKLSVFNGKYNTWRNSQDFLVKRGYSLPKHMTFSDFQQ